MGGLGPLMNGPTISAIDGGALSLQVSHLQVIRPLSSFCYSQSILDRMYEVETIILAHNMPPYSLPGIQHPSQPTLPQYMIVLVSSNTTCDGPFATCLKKYWLWIRLPNILSLFGLWIAELCRKSAKARVRNFPVMSRFLVMYGMDVTATISNGHIRYTMYLYMDGVLLPFFLWIGSYFGFSFHLG